MTLLIKITIILLCIVVAELYAIAVQELYYFGKESYPLVQYIVRVNKEKSETIDVVSLIKKYANEYQVDEGLALNVAFCESGYHNIPNWQGERYGIGIYQFVRSTFDEQCNGNIYNIEDNIRCANKLIARGELWRWNASYKCWHR